MREAGCILLWGHNPSTSLLAGATRIADGARSRRQADRDRPASYRLRGEGGLLAAGAARHRRSAGPRACRDHDRRRLVRCRLRPGLDQRPVPGARGRRPDAARRRAGRGRAWVRRLGRGAGSARRLQHRYPRPSNSRRCGSRCAADSPSPGGMARSPAAPPSTSMPRSAMRCRPTVPPRSAASSRRRSAKRRGCSGSIGRWRITPGPGSSSTATRRKPTGPLRSCTR